MLNYILTWTDDLLGAAHLASGFIALVSGSTIVALPKGRGPHKLLGYLYLVSMVFLNATALSKYDLTGTINLFHGAALISLATLLAGVVAALRYRGSRSPGDVIAHGIFLIWSVYGLVVALLAEVFTRAVPFMLHGEAGWIRFSLALSVFMLLTGLLTQRLIKREVSRFRPRAPDGAPK